MLNEGKMDQTQDKNKDFDLTGLKLPKHVAIIMDGNGRWAKKRGLPRTEGHRRGGEVVRDIVRAAREWGIKNLTLYAFSEENWARSPKEVATLMELLHRYILEERKEIMENQIQLRTAGFIEKLPSFVLPLLKRLLKDSLLNQKMVLTLALSYGSRQELVRAVKNIAELARKGKIKPQNIDENIINEQLFTAGLPDPDIIIRTSGEKRLSNFMLWQAAYSEFYFTSELWPDFNRQLLYQALLDYSNRCRRFGKEE